MRYAISSRYSDWNAGIGTIFSVLGINTWALPYTNFAPNYPGSIISTFFLWYWLFPLLLPRIQRWSNEQIKFRIEEAFWVQIGLGLLVVIGFGGLAGNHVRGNNIFQYVYLYYNSSHLYCIRQHYWRFRFRMTFTGW